MASSLCPSAEAEPVIPAPEKSMNNAERDEIQRGDPESDGLIMSGAVKETTIGCASVHNAYWSETKSNSPSAPFDEVTTAKGT